MFNMTLLAQPKYEFRAAWIATVDNIDWPSRGNYNTESQKQEYIKMLDMHQRNGMNAVVVQVRPATDAFYPSVYEPWSEWLTGKQGKPPYPYYDPLEFMIEEAHKRGMEFHAWCNPYRAEFNIGKSSIAPDHITRTNPEWFLSYGGKRYFDPGNKDAQQFVVNVIRDIVSRYNVDAIHFDDYFYPYRIAGKEFPDDESFKKHGNGLGKDEWRRSNVDSIIVRLSRAIKEENQYCRFGISPFGIWRNNDKDPEGSDTKGGVTNYDDLYADILLWLKEDWIDYVAPQIYWEFGHKAAPYEVLVDWWAKHTYGKHCYIGLGIYRAGSNTAWKDKTQLPRMINAMREHPEIQGAIYFSSKSFEKNPNGWNDSLQNNFYKYPAIIPSMEWVDTIKPMRPVIVKVTGENLANVFVLDIKKHVQSKPIKGYVIYSFNNDDQVRDVEDPKNILQISYTSSSASVMLSTASFKNKIIAVTSLDTNNNESELELVP
jgi:uncharacterized lipoprotein YddW (UPF0748 family)